MLRRRAQAVEHHVHVASNQVLQRGTCTTVRNVGDECPGLYLEQFARQVVRGPPARRTVVELAGRLANGLHEGLEVARQLARIDHQHLRHHRHQGQGHKVFFQVVVEPGVHGGRDGMMDRPHEEVVAIGRDLGGQTCPQVATGTAPVVDHQLLARELGKLA